MFSKVRVPVTDLIFCPNDPTQSFLRSRLMALDDKQFCTLEVELDAISYGWRMSTAIRQLLSGLHGLAQAA